MTEAVACLNVYSMDQSPFFRTDLDGRKVPVSFSELHPILRDVVFYFEVNLNEPQNVLMLTEYSKLEYWKYLSISWAEPEYAESKRYAWLCERGCLALLNGLSLNFLNEQQLVGSDEWEQSQLLARKSLPYLRLFRPSEERLKVGRDLLLASFTFIAEMSADDLNENSMANFSAQTQGAWFTMNVVGDYFRSTAKLDFG